MGRTLAPFPLHGGSVCGVLLWALGMVACRAQPDDGLAPGSTTQQEEPTAGSPDVPETGAFEPDPSWERWEVRAPGYPVPTADTTYVCFGASFTLAEARHIVAFEPIIDQSAVVHHMIISQSVEPLDQLEPCYPGPPEAIMRWGWGPGGTALALPEEAGLPVGSEPGQVHYVLQVHYENPSALEGVVDGSGIAIYTTTELRSEDASLFAVGDVASIIIPPGEPQWPTVFRCSSEATAALVQEPVHVFGSWLHAHRLGRALWTEHYRDGALIGELGRHDPYDFANQRFEPLDATLRPGDELRTHCIYDSSDETEVVFGGGGTNDEMCLNYLLIHPAQPLLYHCND